MGWLYSHRTRRDLIQWIITDTGPSKLLRHCLRGNCLWGLYQLPDGTKFIGLHVLAKNQHLWGYKDMDESVGPVYYTCPKSYIEQASPPCNETAANWRRAVLARSR